MFLRSNKRRAELRHDSLAFVLAKTTIAVDMVKQIAIVTIFQVKHSIFVRYHLHYMRMPIEALQRLAFAQVLNLLSWLFPNEEFLATPPQRETAAPPLKIRCYDNRLLFFLFGFIVQADRLRCFGSHKHDCFNIVCVIMRKPEFVCVCVGKLLVWFVLFGWVCGLLVRFIFSVFNNYLILSLPPKNIII